MSKAQLRKETILAEMMEVRKEILAAASSLPVEKHHRVFLGVWSAADLLAHLEGWDHTNLQAAEQVLAGEVPEFYAHIDRDWKTYNAILVARFKRDNFAELLAAVQNSHQELVNYLLAMPAEEFDKDRGIRVRGYKVTIARLLEAETKDEKIHLEQIRQLAGTP